ncbi:histidine--tRNA ligase [Fictibacillus gelatini]|uniref:histidine--tRNA ligase n=1 Tax=Fictibacillus gelatini TaxID=225985 RepID=UPI000401A22C|nr:histidine--tRNA ligase [Fictibacillus gelatini]
METVLKNVKGTVDYLPQEQALRNRIKRVLEDVFQIYGARPLETPILNYFDIMASKYGGGAEILKEVYQLTDQGERRLALRYDLTIPFAKVIGMNPEMRFPLKRYEMGKVFRDGPVKKGRFREFEQCDVDVVGIQSMAAEADLMMMALDVFNELDLDVTIQFNNRKLLSGWLESLNVNEEQTSDVILTLDKLEKIGADGVKEELMEKQIEAETVKTLETFIEDAAEQNINSFRRIASNELMKEGLAEIEELTAYLEALGIAEKAVFNPFLARGLDIYTGTVYEIFLSDGAITSSIGSGGRYDSIIGNFLQNGKVYPTVGISFGLDVIYTALKDKKKDAPVSLFDVYIIPMDTTTECLKIARRLRQKGIKTEVDLTGRRLKKSLDYANKENIPFVLLFGENERTENKVMVKQMKTGIQEKVPLDQLENYFVNLI